MPRPDTTTQQRVFEHREHWLWKRSDTPNWHIYWYRPGSRRIGRKSTGTSDIDQAKQHLIDFVSNRHGRRQDDAATVPVLEALNHYIGHDLAGRPSQDVAIGALRHFVAFFEREGVEFIAQVSWDVQERYIAWRRDDMIARGYAGSNGTIGRELGVLRAALRAYWKRGRVDRVPFIKGVPSAPPRERFLTPNEFKRLIRECTTPHIWLFTVLGVLTLQRPSAILQLTCDQVDLRRRRIDFLGSGRVQSNKRRPVVRISETLHPVLAEAMHLSRSGYLVEWEGRPVKCVRTAFKKAAKRAGLYDVTPYTLRHTGATLMAAAGVPLRQIAGMLGHTETKTTEMYAKHSPEFMSQATQALDQIFGHAVGLGRWEGQLPLHGLAEPSGPQPSGVPQHRHAA